MICINPSFVPEHNPCNRLKLLPSVEKIFVYGTKDEEGQEMIPILQKEEITNLEIKTIDGADHEFTGMLEEFISLIELV